MSKEPLHISKIRTSIKGGFHAPLSRRTLIVGPNGSRKSAVIQAAEFAVRGRISDISGKDEVGTGIDLLPLGTGEAVMAIAEFNNGQIATARVEANGAGKAKRLRHDVEVGGVVCALHDLRELFGKKGMAAQRAFLLGAMEAGVNQDHILEILGGYFTPAYLRLYTGVQGDRLSPVDALLSCKKSAEQKARFASATVKANEKLINDLAGATPAKMVAKSVVDDAKEHAAGLMRVWTAIVPTQDVAVPATDEAEAAVASWAAEKARLEQLGVEKAKLLEEANSLVQVAPAVRPMDPAQVKRLGALSEVLQIQQGLIAGGRKSCVICSRDIDNPEEVIDATLNALKEALPKGASEADEGLKADAKDAEYKLQQVRSLWADANRSHQQWSAELARLRAIKPSKSNLAYIQKLRADWQAAQDAYVSLEKRYSAYSSLRKARELMETAREDRDTFKRVSTEISRVIATVLARQKDGFVSRVQAYLPARYIFDLQLLNGERKVCRIGFVRDRQLHTALSGAEWTVLLLALGSALTEGAEYALLTPSECDFDPETLSAAMRAMAKGKGGAQILMASTCAPKGRTPAGWTILYTKDLEPALDGEML